MHAARRGGRTGEAAGYFFDSSDFFSGSDFFSVSGLAPGACLAAFKMSSAGSRIGMTLLRMFLAPPPFKLIVRVTKMPTTLPSKEKPGAPGAVEVALVSGI